jgi:hypothetical protein
MAFLYIAEFSNVLEMTAGAVSIAATPPIVEQKVPIGAVQNSNPFNKATRLVRLHCDAICSVAFGNNPTAAISNMRMAANQTEYFKVNGGPVPDQISVITNV